MEIVKISETKFVRKIKSLPISTQRITGIMVLAVLFIALPLFIWAVATQRVFFKKQAASGEMSGEPGVCIAVNNIISVTPISDTMGTCHDIQTAIDAVAGDGYTIIVNPGQYDINQTIFVNKPNLTISGNSNTNTVINASITNGYVFNIPASSVSINRLYILGNIQNGGLITSYQNNNANFDQLKLNSQGSRAFDIHNSTNVSITNSEIKSTAAGIEALGSNYILIENNKIYMSSPAISIVNSGYATINKNLVHNNTGGALIINQVNNTDINHNSFVYNSGSVPTISISGTITSPNIFSQNIVAFNSGQGIYKDTNTNNFSTISYNDVFSNYTGYDYVGMTNLTGTNGNISADPKLDIASGYYCLLTGSPALYGSVNDHEYMGRNGPCTTYTPQPSPSINPINCNKPIFIQIPNFSTQSGEPGQKVRFNISIENVNNSPPCGNYVSHLIVDKPSNWSAVFEQPDFNLAGGQTINTYLDITPPTDHYFLGDQVFPIRLSTDRYGVLGNGSVNYHLKSSLSNADLAITNITVERSSPPQTACESYVYRITVKNIGTEPALKTRLQSYFEPFQPQTIEGCNQIKNYSGSNSPIPDIESKLYLEPGESVVFNDYFNPSADGQITIRAFADKDEILTEHNEYNNYLSKTFDVKKVYPEPDLIPGDVNHDGHVNIVDIGIIIDNYRLSPINDPRADINNDGVVNIVDIGIIIDNYEL